MKVKKIFVFALVLAAFLPIFQLGASGKGERSNKIALMISNRSNEFFSVLERSFLETAKGLNYQVELYDAGNDATKQPDQVQDAVTKGVKAIVLNPLNIDATTSVVNTAIAKGIPVLTIDTTIEGAKLLAEVATDNIDGGQVAAEWLVKKSKINPHELTGLIHMKGIDGHTAHITRYAGFNKYLKSGAVEVGWKTLANNPKKYIELTGNFAQDVAQSALESKLGDLDSSGKYVVYCENDVMGY